ncbi:hypothetical protein QFZ34_001190 [Phyllobacterium ifriqiyense]|uniref:Uncharacterized protein n=1 Tax=Phyllobacterium ifriqiyense TaxID=314238 RepID=A0ABU0S5H1_9HYPH|nr:hypothetical protein [Phyllobacterium ifriqiyense]MDQ0996013.1 hypothetical protein [Phyllobacterium ifriqiyense]
MFYDEPRGSVVDGDEAKKNGTNADTLRLQMQKSTFGRAMQSAQAPIMLDGKFADLLKRLHEAEK